MLMASRRPWPQYTQLHTDKKIIKIRNNERRSKRTLVTMNYISYPDSKMKIDRFKVYMT
jgi:hypothetical protein